LKFFQPQFVSYTQINTKTYKEFELNRITYILSFENSFVFTWWMQDMLTAYYKNKIDTKMSWYLSGMNDQDGSFTGRGWSQNLITAKKITKME